MIARAADVRLTTLFSPPHGIREPENRTNLANGIDERTVAAWRRQVASFLLYR